MYTSLKLSKLLAENGCDIQSDYYYFVLDRVAGEFVEFGEKEWQKRYKQVAEYPAYDILNDLCVKYAKEVFGGYAERRPRLYGMYSAESSTEYVLSLLQQGKQEEAEIYIWANCLFNPNNR